MANNVENLLAALIAPFDDIEYAMQQLIQLRDIANAFGVGLDFLGAVVGQKRNGLDDDLYRRYLAARIATNRSKGTTKDLILIARLILDDTYPSVTVKTEPIATARVQLFTAAVTDALAAVVFSFLQQGAAAGVRLLLEWVDVDPTQAFTFDTGPGFDVGHLAGSLG